MTKSEKEQRFAEARRTINRANYIVFRMRSDLDTGLPIDNRQFTAFVSQMTHADEIIRSVFVAQELDRHARTQ